MGSNRLTSSWSKDEAPGAVISTGAVVTFAMAKQAEKRDLIAFAKAHGVRLTGQRRIILEVLAASDAHPDALELHRLVAKAHPSISLATVYRTVNLLEEKGVLEKHTFADGRSRYESTIGTHHHHHMINVETGDVIEFSSEEFERLHAEICRKHGYEVVDHKLELYVRPIKRPTTDD